MRSSTTPKGHQVEIDLDDPHETRLRIVVSPLASVAANLFEVVGARRPDPPDAWDALLRRRLRTVELGPLDVFRLRSPVPDFLLPVPAAGRHTFEAEVETLRATPDLAILAGLEREFGGSVPVAYAGMLADPRAGLERYCAALRAFWHRVLEPSWPQVRRLIEREVLVRGSQLALDGPARTLAALHPRMALEGETLRYSSSHSAALRLEGRPLSLLPLICSPNGILTNEAHPDAVRLGYTPPGLAELCGAPPPDPGAQLVSLLGQSRARLLAALLEPASTTELAQRFRFAPSTVSHHLGALAEIGLVEASRVGVVVLYRASPRGERLLELFDQDA